MAPCPPSQTARTAGNFTDDSTSGSINSSSFTTADGHCVRHPHVVLREKKDGIVYQRDLCPLCDIEFAKNKLLIQKRKQAIQQEKDAIDRQLKAIEEVEIKPANVSRNQSNEAVQAQDPCSPSSLQEPASQNVHRHDHHHNHESCSNTSRPSYSVPSHTYPTSHFPLGLYEGVVPGYPAGSVPLAHPLSFPSSLHPYFQTFPTQLLASFDCNGVDQQVVGRHARGQNTNSPTQKEQEWSKLTRDMAELKTAIQDQSKALTLAHEKLTQQETMCGKLRATTEKQATSQAAELTLLKDKLSEQAKREQELRGQVDEQSSKIQEQAILLASITEKLASMEVQLKQRRKETVQLNAHADSEGWGEHGSSRRSEMSEHEYEPQGHRLNEGSTSEQNTERTKRLNVPERLQVEYSKTNESPSTNSNVSVAKMEKPESPLQNFANSCTESDNDPKGRPTTSTLSEMQAHVVETKAQSNKVTEIQTKTCMSDQLEKKPKPEHSELQSSTKAIGSNSSQDSTVNTPLLESERTIKSGIISVAVNPISNSQSSSNKSGTIPVAIDSISYSQSSTRSDTNVQAPKGQFGNPGTAFMVRQSGTHSVEQSANGLKDQITNDLKDQIANDLDEIQGNVSSSTGDKADRPSRFSVGDNVPQPFPTEEVTKDTNSIKSEYVEDSISSGRTVESSTYGEDRARVQNKALIDPYGDNGIYTGVVLRSTGMPHGCGRIRYEDASRTYDGDWVHGRWHGFGKASFVNGDAYEGYYKYDKRHGSGKYSWSDGRIYEGSFREDKRHGKGTFSWPDGSSYSGEFVDGQREGYGIYKFRDGGEYIGYWRNGSYHGFGTCRWADGRLYRGEWSMGKAHGTGTETNSDGSVRHSGKWIHNNPVKQTREISGGGHSRGSRANINVVSVPT